jgi:hypothetical protein
MMAVSSCLFWVALVPGHALQSLSRPTVHTPIVLSVSRPFLIQMCQSIPAEPLPVLQTFTNLEPSTSKLNDQGPLARKHAKLTTRYQIAEPVVARYPWWHPGNKFMPAPTPFQDSGQGRSPRPSNARSSRRGTTIMIDTSPLYLISKEK